MYIVVSLYIYTHAYCIYECVIILFLTHDDPEQLKLFKGFILIIYIYIHTYIHTYIHV
jgi:hypothetical protein